MLAERYVESVAALGQGGRAIRHRERVVGQERRLASRTLHSEPARCRSGRPIGSISRSPTWIKATCRNEAHWQRGSVVFVRTGYGHRVENGTGRDYADYPVLMAIGISAKPQDFAALEGDFERLLKQTVLGDVGQGLSMNGETTCTLAQAQATSGGEAAPGALSSTKPRRSRWPPRRSLRKLPAP